MATWLKRLAVVLVMAGIVVGVNDSPALALGPGGCGTNCNGKDPNVYRLFAVEGVALAGASVAW